MRLFSIQFIFQPDVLVEWYLLKYRPRQSQTKQITTIIARETAPLSSHVNMFVNDTMAAQRGAVWKSASIITEKFIVL